MKPATPRRGTAGEHFRNEIEKAEADGFAREVMALRLTYGDVSQLKRDPALPISDISFVDGVMRYLGVRVVQSRIVESILDRAGAENDEPEAPPVKKKAVRKASTTPRKPRVAKPKAVKPVASEAPAPSAE